MNHTFARYGLAAALSLSLAACGPLSVSPGDGSAVDGAVDDGATQGMCSAPIPLMDSDADAVWTVDFARAQSGYVGVIATRAGEVYAQAYDRSWAAVGERLALPSVLSAVAGSRQQPTVAFEAERGAITYGSSLHEVTMSPTGALSLVRSFVAEQGATRFSLLGAWPRTDGLGRLHVTAITTDGSAWTAADGRFALTSASTQDARFYDAAVQFPTTYSDYLAFDTVPRRASNNDVRVRKYIPGHGMMLLSTERTERGTMLAAPVRVGDSLWRLHYQFGEPAMALSAGLSLVEHNSASGATLTRTAIEDNGMVLSGAIASREGNTDATRLLLAWTRAERPSPMANEVVVQWGASGARAVIARSAFSPVFHGAWVETSDTRGWIVYGLYDTAASPRRRIFAQCVSR
ncbi:MAG: hypothetical protein Q8Q09_06930 [Deltaproteobacteria bacterium]|nr:hypothetical protein [Deltaproteobacteria bacterium]